jgi:hypothetical protein
VIAPDLTGWAVATGLRPSRLLRRLAGVVEPGGFLYAGFANRLCPARSGVPGSLRLSRAVHDLALCGLAVVDTYVALPDQCRPALLACAAGGAELEYALRDFPFALDSSAPESTAPRARSVLRALVRPLPPLTVPATLRARFASALAVVAVRPVATESCGAAVSSVFALPAASASDVPGGDSTERARA